MTKRIVLFCVVLGCCGSAFGDDKATLREKAAAAAKDRILCARVQGEMTETRAPLRSAKDIEKMVGEYQRQVSSFKNKLEFTKAERDRMVADYRASLQSLQAGTGRTSTVSIAFFRKSAMEGFARREEVVTADTRDGTPSQQTLLPGETIVNEYIVTLNPDAIKTYMPNVKSAEIQQGLRGRAQTFESTGMNGFDLTSAGRSGIHLAEDNAILSITERVTDDGERIITAVIQWATEEEHGVSEISVEECLPDKDYVVKSSLYFRDGQLFFTKRFNDYRKIEGGRWYPFFMEKSEYEGTLPENVIEQLKAGAIREDDPAVVGHKDLQRVKHRTFAITSIELLASLPEDMFDQEFPYGTNVADWTRADAQGNALRYRLGIDPVPLDIPAGDALDSSHGHKTPMNSAPQESPSPIWLAPAIIVGVILLSLLLILRRKK